MGKKSFKFSFFSQFLFLHLLAFLSHILFFWCVFLYSSASSIFVAGFFPWILNIHLIGKSVRMNEFMCIHVCIWWLIVRNSSIASGTNHSFWLAPSHQNQQTNRDWNSNTQWFRLNVKWFSRTRGKTPTL